MENQWLHIAPADKIATEENQQKEQEGPVFINTCINK